MLKLLNDLNGKYQSLDFFFIVRGLEEFMGLYLRLGVRLTSLMVLN